MALSSHQNGLLPTLEFACDSLDSKNHIALQREYVLTYTHDEKDFPVDSHSRLCTAHLDQLDRFQKTELDHVETVASVCTWCIAFDYSGELLWNILG